MYWIHQSCTQNFTVAFKHIQAKKKKIENQGSATTDVTVSRYPAEDAKMQGSLESVEKKCLFLSGDFGSDPKQVRINKR